MNERSKWKLYVCDLALCIKFIMLLILKFAFRISISILNIHNALYIYYSFQESHKDTHNIQ